MKKPFVFLVAIVAFGFASSANAADMPTKAGMVAPIPIWNWTGFYTGINGGAGLGRSTQTDTTGLTTGSFSQSGGVVGGTLGYNWQNANYVLGIEADWDWANISGTTTVNCAFGCTTKVNSFGTLRPRIGITWNNVLIYATGGLAWGSIYGGQPGFTNTRTNAGWTAGAGAEYMFAPRWSAKVEYLFANLESVNYVIVIPVNATERNLNIIRGGINYHF